MQPYLFPYLGYFQLVNAVERFVFLDDVSFIKGGWINRNRLILSGAVHYFTVPLSGAGSRRRKINEVSIMDDPRWRRKISESIRQSYSRAPYFRDVNELFSEVLYSNETSIAELAKQSVLATARYLDIDTEFVMSSAVYANNHLRAAHRILDICARENAREYYNLPGGRALYDEDAFRSSGIELHFIAPDVSDDAQPSQGFRPGLSIVDLLMFNDRKVARNALQLPKPQH